MSDSRLGPAVRSVRIARGMTQGQVAARASISRQQLIAIEGGFGPTEGTLRRVVGALGFALYGDLLTAANGPLDALKAAPKRCESCGAPIASPGARQGRPRKRCASCASDRGAVAKRWREAHPDRVDEYNARRRVSA